jgi:hypothetical protein
VRQCSSPITRCSPAELARALESRSFEWLWAPEHSHIPTSRKTAFPQGGELSKEIRGGDGWQRRCRELGVARVVVSLPSAGAAEIPPALDRWAELISRTEQR